MNASAEPTRSPPIQCSVETSTPSTSTVLSDVLPRGSYPNGMEALVDVSNRYATLTVPCMPNA